MTFWQGIVLIVIVSGSFSLVCLTISFTKFTGFKKDTEEKQDIFMSNALRHIEEIVEAKFRR